ncbi:serine/arginine-rich splicing factor 6 [Sigmodon hispidus]
MYLNSSEASAECIHIENFTIERARYTVWLTRPAAAGRGTFGPSPSTPAPQPCPETCRVPPLASGNPSATAELLIYIGRLSYKDLQHFFSSYRRLLEINLKNGLCGVRGLLPTPPFRSSTARSWAESAPGPSISLDCDGYNYGSRNSGGGSSSRRTSGRDKYGPPVRTEYGLLVENLSSRCCWQDLKEFMRQAGEVTCADTHKECANEGVIEFSSYSDMNHALDKLDGTEINGRNIRLFEDKPRTRP